MAYPPFVCFVKYKEFKFDVVIHQTGLAFPKTFDDIEPKIAQIFNVAMQKQLDSNSLLFEVSLNTLNNQIYSPVP